MSPTPTEPIPTTTQIRHAFALHKLNTDEDLVGLSAEECRARVEEYHGWFDRWATENGVKVVLDEPEIEEAEVRENG